MNIGKEYFHSIQLKKIQMISLKCNYNEENEGVENNSSVRLDIDNAGKVLAPNKGVCYLKVGIVFEDKENEPFNIEVIYKGYCESMVDIDEANLEFYLKVQSIPMLWAYARETINNNIMKMGLPSIVLPAININEVLGEISKGKEMGEK